MDAKTLEYMRDRVKRGDDILRQIRVLEEAKKQFSPDYVGRGIAIIGSNMNVVAAMLPNDKNCGAPGFIDMMREGLPKLIDHEIERLQSELDKI